MNNAQGTPLFTLGRLSTAIACITLAQGASAQDTPLIVEAPLPDTPLENAAQVTPAVVQQLRAATNDSASLLRDVPGVSLNGAGGVSSLPSIRGLADDRLRIKVDGTDLIAACPNHMNPPLSYIEPSQIGQLKVFAGITPVSVGGDSIGGTVVADRAEPEFARDGEGRLNKGEVGAFYRSNNDAMGGNVSATHASENLSIRYDGAWSQADNYTAGSDFKTSPETGRPGHTLPLDEVGSTAYETQNHSLSLAFRNGDDLFEGRLSVQDMPEQLYPNQRMDLLDNEQTLANLAWTRRMEWGMLKARAYHEDVDHYMDFGADKRYWYGALSGPGNPCSPIGFMVDGRDQTCAAGMPMYSESANTGLSLKADIDLSTDDLLRLGAEYQRYRLDDYWTASGGGMGPNTFQNVNNGQRDRTALFAELEARHTDQWLTLTGIRYERVDMDADRVHGYSMMAGQAAETAAFNASDRSQTDHNIDLTALARYRHSDNLDIELGLARKVRSPNLYERYTWSSWPMAATMNNFVGDGNGYLGDIELNPEVAYTASARFDWHAQDRRWFVTATPFYTHVNDYIDAVQRPGWQADQFNVLQYDNQDARLYGIDLAMQMPLASTDWGDWGLQGVINYTNGQNRDTGDDLYNIMPLNGRFTLTHRQAGWDNAVEWVVVDEKDSVSDVRNELQTDGYSLINLRASHSWQQTRLDFGIENLFDRGYALPTGGVYTGQGRTMSMNGIPWGIAVPGMGRSAYVGVKVTF
ncbi:TonB-dependent receptor [Marinobacterium weihaiense]|uniref:TonB-dependent receptor n=1 Tax=Marinobacterium weihaiense TaxID=2851016 RepID=A0ABS6M742_9GAMM|nr:TonB-dependent receptor [Marinobacterium weihaiense]MBV0932108.1 TonB-dependent receptor [Marinobacterium weihaiense]